MDKFEELARTSSVNTPTWSAMRDSPFWKDDRMFSSAEATMLMQGRLQDMPNGTAQDRINSINYFYNVIFGQVIKKTSFKFAMRPRKASDKNLQLSRGGMVGTDNRRMSDRNALNLDMEHDVKTKELPDPDIVFSEDQLEAAGITQEMFRQMFPNMGLIKSFSQQELNNQTMCLVQMLPNECKHVNTQIRTRGRDSYGTRFWYVTNFWNPTFERPSLNGKPLYFHQARSLGIPYEVTWFCDMMFFLEFEFARCPKKHYIAPIMSTLRKRVCLGSGHSVKFSSMCNYAEPVAPYRPLSDEQLVAIGASPTEIRGTILKGRNEWVVAQHEYKANNQQHTRVEKKSGNIYNEHTDKRQNGKIDRSTICFSTSSTTVDGARRRVGSTHAVASGSDSKFPKADNNDLQIGGSSYSSRRATGTRQKKTKLMISRRTDSKGVVKAMLTVPESVATGSVAKVRPKGKGGKLKQNISLASSDAKKNVLEVPDIKSLKLTKEDSDVLAHLRTRVTTEISALPTAKISLFISEYSTLPVSVLMRAFGAESIDEICDMIALNDPPEVRALYEPYMRMILTVDEGCDNRLKAIKRIGKLWIYNLEEEKIIEQGFYCVRNRIFQYVKSNGVPAPINMPQPKLVNKAAFLGHRMRNALHLHCGFSKPTNDASLENRTFTREETVFAVNLHEALMAACRRMRTRLQDMNLGNNDKQKHRFSEPPDQVFFRHAMESEPGMAMEEEYGQKEGGEALAAGISDDDQDDRDNLVFGDEEDEEDGSGAAQATMQAATATADASATPMDETPSAAVGGGGEHSEQVESKHDPTYFEAFVNTGSAAKIALLDCSKLFPHATFTSIFNQMITPIDRQPPLRPGAISESTPMVNPGNRGNSNNSRAVPDSGIKMVERETLGSRHSVLGRVNNKTDIKAHRNFQPSHNGYLCQWETPHGKESGHTKNTSIGFEMSSDPTYEDLSEFENWCVAHDGAMAFRIERMDHTRWLFGINDKVVCSFLSGKVDAFVTDLFGIRQNPKSPLAFRQMSVCVDRRTKTVMAHVKAHRAIRPVMAVDMKTQRILLPEPVAAALETIRKTKTLLGVETEVHNKDRLRVCQLMYQTMVAYGAIFYMDAKEMCLLRVCPSPSLLGSSDRVFDVCEISPDVLSGVIAATIPNRNKCGAQRVSIGLSGLKQLFSLPSMQRDLATKNSTRLLEPHFPPIHTAFGFNTVHSLPSSKVVYGVAACMTNKEPEDSGLHSALSNEMNMCQFVSFKDPLGYPISVFLNMRKGLNVTRQDGLLNQGASMTEHVSFQTLSGGMKEPLFRFRVPPPHAIDQFGLAPAGSERSWVDHVGMKRYAQLEDFQSRHLDQFGMAKVLSDLRPGDTFMQFAKLTKEMHSKGFDEFDQCEIPPERIPFHREKMIRAGRVVYSEITTRKDNNIGMARVVVSSMGKLGVGKKKSNVHGNKQVLNDDQPTIECPWDSAGNIPATFFQPHGEFARVMASSLPERIGSRVTIAQPNKLLDTTSQLAGCDLHCLSTALDSSRARQPNLQISADHLEYMLRMVDPLSGGPATNLWAKVDAQTAFDKVLGGAMREVKNHPLDCTSSSADTKSKRKREEPEPEIPSFTLAIDDNKIRVTQAKRCQGDSRTKLYLECKDMNMEQANLIRKASLLVDGVSPLVFRTRECPCHIITPSELESLLALVPIEFDATFLPEVIPVTPAMPGGSANAFSGLKFNHRNSLRFELDVSFDTKLPEWAPKSDDTHWMHFTDEPHRGASKLYASVGAKLEKEFKRKFGHMPPFKNVSGRPKAAGKLPMRVVFAGEINWVPLHRQDLFEDTKFPMPPRIPREFWTVPLMLLGKGDRVCVDFIATRGSSMSHGNRFAPARVFHRQSMNVVPKRIVTHGQALNVFRACGNRASGDGQVFASPTKKELEGGTFQLKVVDSLACSDCKRCYKFVDVTPKTDHVAIVIEADHSGILPEIAFARAKERAQLESLIKEIELF